MKRITLKRFHSEPKRKGGGWKKWLAFALIVISAGFLAYAVNLPGYQIKDVEIEGAVLSDKDMISTIAEESITGRYAFIIPRSFFWLYPKSAIRAEIETMPSILGADFEVNRDSQTLIIFVKEREQKYLWCLPAGEAGLPVGEAGVSDKPKCFYMDGEGFIFTEAPLLEGNVFLTFFSILQNNPVGQYFLPEPQMQELLSFIDSLKALGLSAKAVNAVSLFEIRIMLESGTEIIVSFEEPLQSVLDNLEILVASADFTEASGGVEKLQYIDLRYGAKAFWK